jgi:hypothetical protein
MDGGETRARVVARGAPARTSMWRAAGLAILAVMVGALLVAPSAEAKGAKRLFGLNYAFKEITSKDARMLKKSGAKTVRWIMFWPRIQPTSGDFNWSQPDKLVGDLAAKGIRVLPIMWGSPKWVANRSIIPPLGSQRARDAWQDFLRAAVNRYGPKGKFWKGPYKQAHGKKPAVPITTWDIWNEPNLSGAMSPPDPALYAKLLKLSDSAINDANRHAKVMFGGLLAHSPSGATAWDFLRRVYNQPGARKDFDVMALHAYAPSVDQVLEDVGHMRKVMGKNRDRKTPLWIAEIGWGSLPKDPGNYGATKGLQGQKRILKQSFRKLKKKRQRWHIKKVLWFNFRDPAGGNTQVCAYCTSAGLLKNDFQPKPAWSAFRKFTH